jgi:hypothetical protein
MAMNDYVLIDSKKYLVLSDSYVRSMEPQKAVENGVLGNTIVSMGPGTSKIPISLMLYIPYTPSTGYGTVTDIQTAADKISISFSDHVTSGVWGSGTFNVTIISVSVTLLSGSQTPENGFIVAIEMTKIL